MWCSQTLRNVNRARPQKIIERLLERVAEVHPESRKGPSAFLAEKLSVTKGAVTNWRQPGRDLPASKWPKAAALVGWSVEQLCGADHAPSADWLFSKSEIDRIAALPPQTQQLFRLQALQLLRHLEADEASLPAGEGLGGAPNTVPRLVRARARK